MLRNLTLNHVWVFLVEKRWRGRNIWDANSWTSNLFLLILYSSVDAKLSLDHLHQSSSYLEVEKQQRENVGEVQLPLPSTSPFNVQRPTFILDSIKNVDFQTVGVIVVFSSFLSSILCSIYPTTQPPIQETLIETLQGNRKYVNAMEHFFWSIFICYLMMKVFLNMHTGEPVHWHKFSLFALPQPF